MFISMRNKNVHTKFHCINLQCIKPKYIPIEISMTLLQNLLLWNNQLWVEMR